MSQPPLYYILTTIDTFTTTNASANNNLPVYMEYIIDASPISLYGYHITVNSFYAAQ